MRLLFIIILTYFSFTCCGQQFHKYLSGNIATSTSLADIVPPQITSAVLIDPDTIQVTFTESVTGVTTSGFDFDGSVTGNNITATSVTQFTTSSYKFRFSSSFTTEDINMDYSSGSGTVTDDASNDLASFVDFTVTNPIGLLSFETECADVGIEWSIREDVTASGELLTVSEEFQYAGSAPTDPDAHIVWTIDVPTTDTYYIFARHKSPTVGDDSFWFKENEGSWLLVDVVVDTDFSWHEIGSYSLTAGINTLTAGIREDGHQLDKIEINTSGVLPTGAGGTSITCTNQPPVVVNPGTQIHSESDVISLQIVATDINSGDILNYSETGLPSGLSLNPSTGLISGTLTASAGTYSVDLSVSDGELFTTEDFDYIIQAGSPPEVVAPIANQQGIVDVFAQVIVDLNTVFDDDGGTAALTYTIDNNTNTTLAPSPSISGSDILTVNLASGVVGTTEIRIKAEDADLNTVNDTFSITTIPAPPVSSGGLKAFPTAEGFGKNTVGGRDSNATIYQVTSLSDDGSVGTLRYGIETLSGPRIIIFRVGGIINLTGGTMDIENPNITIFGQTAPGDGIYLNGDPSGNSLRMRIRTGEVIIRGTRHFLGSSAQGKDVLGIGGNPVSNIILDHLTIGWGTDECVGMNGGGGDISDWTIQNSMIMEGQNFQSHGYGLGFFSSGPGDHVEVYRGSFIYNIVANNAARFPYSGGAGEGAEAIEIYNNILYNYRGAATSHTGDSTRTAVIGNLYKPGGNIINDGQNIYTGDDMSNAPALGYASVYIEDNWNIVQNAPATLRWDEGGFNPYEDLAPAFTTSDYVPFSVFTLDETDILNMGAIPHHPDIETRTYDSYVSGSAGIIDYFTDVGGVPTGTFSGGTPPTDTDGDGLPDSWESANGPDNTSLTSTGDHDGDGYLNIEEWANEIYGEFTPFAPIFDQIDSVGMPQWEKISLQTVANELQGLGIWDNISCITNMGITDSLNVVNWKDGTAVGFNGSPDHVAGSGYFHDETNGIDFNYFAPGALEENIVYIWNGEILANDGDVSTLFGSGDGTNETYLTVDTETDNFVYKIHSTGLGGDVIEGVSSNDILTISRTYNDTTRLYFNDTEIREVVRAFTDVGEDDLHGGRYNNNGTIQNGMNGFGHWFIVGDSTLLDHLDAIKTIINTSNATYATNLSTGDVTDPTPGTIDTVAVQNDAIVAEVTGYSDNVAVTQFNWRLDDVEVANTSTPEYTYTGLTPNVGYTISLTTEDAAGNESVESNEFSITTKVNPPVPILVTDWETQSIPSTRNYPPDDFRSTLNGTGTVGISTDFASSGTKSVKCEISSGATGVQRSEINIENTEFKSIPEGASWSYEWKVYLPAGHTYDSKPSNWLQIKTFIDEGDDFVASADFAFRYENGDLKAHVKSDDRNPNPKAIQVDEITQIITDITKGSWHHFVVDYTYDPSGSGYIEVFYNEGEARPGSGDSIFTYSGQTGFYNAVGSYFKVGIYGLQSATAFSTTQTVYIDDITLRSGPSGL